MTDKKIIKYWAKNIGVVEEPGEGGKKYIQFDCGSHGCFNKIEEFEIKHKSKEDGVIKGKIRCRACRTYNGISYAID